MQELKRPASPREADQRRATRVKLEPDDEREIRVDGQERIRDDAESGEQLVVIRGTIQVE